MKRLDWETCSFVSAVGGDIAHTLSAEGADTSEDGSGRGTPVVGFGWQEAIRFKAEEEMAGTLTKNQTQAVAFSSKDYGADAAVEMSPTLRSGDHGHSHANGGAPPAVAFSPLQGGRSMPVTGESPTLEAGTGNKTPAVLSNSVVRRLTPVECERLQGFAPVVESVMLLVCVDHLKNCASVVLRCRRSRGNASLAGESAWLPFAHPAEGSFSICPERSDVPVVASVRISSGGKLQEVHSRGRLLWSAKSAGGSGCCRQHTPAADIAGEIVHIVRDVVSVAIGGKVESRQSIRLSSPEDRGGGCATPSGESSSGDVRVASNVASVAKFTTSDLIASFQKDDSTSATLCCFALTAISGFTRNETSPETFCLLIDVESEYTAIPWRKKPAADCPDGPRYKALGNSMAVPVMSWIGQRIEMVDKL